MWVINYTSGALGSRATGSFSGLAPNPGQIRAIPNTVRTAIQPAVMIQMTVSAFGPAGAIP
jgi:hypothetical protein